MQIQDHQTGEMFEVEEVERIEFDGGVLVHLINDVEPLYFDTWGILYESDDQEGPVVVSLSDWETNDIDAEDAREDAAGCVSGNRWAKFGYPYGPIMFDGLPLFWMLDGLLIGSGCDCGHPADPGQC